jgi:hypothetical protein
MQLRFEYMVYCMHLEKLICEYLGKIKHYIQIFSKGVYVNQEPVKGDPEEKNMCSKKLMRLYFFLSDFRRSTFNVKIIIICHNTRQDIKYLGVYITVWRKAYFGSFCTYICFCIP